MTLVSRLTGRRELCDAAFEITLQRPPGFLFRPGQHLRLFLEGLERDYTPVSAPADPDLTLLVRKMSGGRVSSALAALPVGATLSFTGPHGRFLFRPSDRTPLFVATGTGVAPFVSMARSGVRGFLLLHGVPRREELHYRETLRGSASRFMGCVSRESCPEETELFPGRVTGFLRERCPRGGHDFYLCGREEMVRDVIRLVDDRFPGARVYAEVFH